MSATLGTNVYNLPTVPITSLHKARTHVRCKYDSLVQRLDRIANEDSEKEGGKFDISEKF